jgi:hypothetical protein
MSACGSAEAALLTGRVLGLEGCYASNFPDALVVTVVSALRYGA